MRQAAREALRKLHAALAAGEYERAQAALGELKAAAEGMAAGSALDEAFLGEALGGLERGRRLVLAARAHDAARLARLRKLPADYGEAGAARHAVRLEA